MTQMRPAAQHYGPGTLFTKQGIYEESLTQKHALGERIQVGDRTFYYIHVNGEIVAGQVAGTPALAGCTTTLQTAVPVSVAAVAGATRVYVTAVTTAQAANLYAEGYATITEVTETPDAVYTMRIKGNSLLAISGTASYIDFYDEIPVALDTSDRLALHVCIFKDVIAMPISTAVGVPLGVAPITFTDAYHGWLQTWGPCGIRMEVGAVGIGTDIIMATTPAAAGSPIVDDAAIVGVRIGYLLNIGTDNYGALAMLQILP